MSYHLSYQWADIVSWVMVVYVCVRFPQGLAESFAKLYVFRPPLFLCNVKCSGLTCALLLGTPCHAQLTPPSPFCHALFFLICLSFFALLPLFLHSCTFKSMHACLICVQHVTPWTVVLLHNLQRNWNVYMRNIVMKYLVCLLGWGENVLMKCSQDSNHCFA